MIRPLLALALLLALSVPAAATEPLRVASLVPLVEGALAKIPENAVLVASVRRWPGAPLPAGAADLGSPHAPSLEALHGARPDLLVIDAVLNAALADKLGRADWELLALDTSSVELTFEGLLALGRKAGAEPRMREAVDAARAELKARRLAKPVRVLTVFAAPGSPLVVTSRTWLGDLLGSLGFADVAAGHSGSERMPGYAQVSAEVLATLEPDVLFVVAHGRPDEVEASFRRDLAERAMWRGASRSAQGRVYMLDPLLFSANPGLDLTRAAGWLLERAAQPPAASEAK